MQTGFYIDLYVSCHVGVPPADEVTILSSQLLLLHTQLMFERHKSELHAKRNRRLLGRTVKTVALEEQYSAMVSGLFCRGANCCLGVNALRPASRLVYQY